MSPPEEVECDVVIVGGGPAGCTCALYTSRANLKTVMLDKNPAAGALAITSHIANYPGVEDTQMSGAALLERMRDQAIEYGTVARPPPPPPPSPPAPSRPQVFLVEADGDSKTVYTPDLTVKARALVLATGAMGRPPSFKGEDCGGPPPRGRRQVSYCATCDGAFYQDREVAVVGVNAEAVEEAQFLTKFASTVHWVTAVDPKPDDAHAQTLLAPPARPPARPPLLAHAAHSPPPNVKHWSQTRMTTIEGDDSGVTGALLHPKKGDGEPISLPVEGVFIYVAGSKPITDFLDGQAVELNPDGGVKVDEEMATNVPGVYAIGDIRNTPYKQVVVAASDGCIAAMSIDRFLKGRKTIKVDWIHK
ncbi:hypothetical protein EMIHUDRAFT_61543 [Emiliania huxleyi CCMP1516]|uniref:FAD/NAD(P)-binding domain-containing protein n=2 Tax=Emiliania huxleyi TaxID=2903 RepID=A0A0D3J4L4_EMIH1|nr:hypothetical protein EMIHUDRAFT_61543 [Emiliania huxleyi CCMP1516]EOD18449.1 hypothetical protein EMIHUDRAFT_61543 [Emiliania huxleyi CCMP1516]|eukprot:XP_005770878.1 hypothetical protein EMIHUDRAFT_61543 [Emiliania huxleyi CCMP1516]